MIVRSPAPTPHRRGTTLAETLVLIPVFLSLVLGMIDLGLCVLRQQIVSRAARQGARLAIVHGLAAPSGFSGGTWGTSTISASAGSSGIPIVDGLKDNGYLNMLDPSQTQILVEWIDGSNDPESERNRVRVTVTSVHQSMVGMVFGNASFNLSAASVMTVAH